MAETQQHTPYGYALSMINQVAESVNAIALAPDGTPRDMPGSVAAALLHTRSNLAVASALLAIADAGRPTP